MTDRLTQEAIAFITKNQTESWCVYLSHFAVHTPLDAKRELVDKYAAKRPGELHNHINMATMIEAVDQGVGQLLQCLDQLGIANQTVVIFYSDNGGYGPATDMKPLKGYKGTYYEGGIRVPLVVRWPGVVAAGSTCDQPITGVDFYPTLCSIAGTTRPPGQIADGLDFVPLLRKDDSDWPARAIFWHFPAYLQSYQVWDEQRDPLFRSRPTCVMRQGAWKLHYFFEDQATELYNLEDDIGETNDLSSQQPKVVAKMLAAMNAWQKTVKAPLPQTPNPNFDAEAERQAIEKLKRRARQKKAKAASAL